MFFLCVRQTSKTYFMAKHIETGLIGEHIAANHLRKNGYKILERNVWYKFGELDIVAKSRDGTLVCVEVKTTRGWNPHGIQPEDQMTSAKLKKFRRAASCYISSHSELMSERRGFRLDLVAVFIIGEGKDSHYVRHYENV